MLAESLENRKIVYAIVGSLLLHMLTLIVMGVAGSLLDRKPPVPEEKKDQPVELTILPPEPSPEQRQRDAVFARTPEELLSEKAPETADFESDKNTLAASELAASGAAPVPSQEGRELPGLNLETTRFTPGEEPRPSMASLPSRPQLAVAARPTPALKKKQAAPSPTPPPDALALLPPEPTPKPTPKEQPPEKDESQRPKPPSEAAPQSLPGYQPQQEKSKVRGSIDSRGRASVNALGTPLGRYQKAISDAIGSRWNLYIQPLTDRIDIGSVAVKFYVTSDGKVKGLRVMKNSSNDFFATCTVQAVMEAEIPPIPNEVAATLDQNRLEVEYTFTVYGGR